MLNMDGAAKGNLGPVGDGGLIRGPQGIVEAFLERYGSCTSTRAELNAVFRGLRMTRIRGICKLLVCVDSRIVENLLMADVPGVSPFYHILRQCMAL